MTDTDRKRKKYMRFLIQRVTSADVSVEGNVIGSITQGYLVFVGISATDTEEIADRMVQKMLRLRIFSDENGKTNLSLDQVQGQLLLVSQFTLYANCRKGNRPSFLDAGDPNEARKLFDHIVEMCRQSVSVVRTGSFGADMQVRLCNDGPFTIMLDSDEILR